MKCLRFAFSKAILIFVTPIIITTLSSRLVKGYFVRTSSELMIQIQQTDSVIQQLESVEKTLLELEGSMHAEN